MTLHRLPSGHRYEIQVCSVDEAERVLSSSERVPVLVPSSNGAPTIWTSECTPDYMTIQWQTSAETRSSTLIMNGDTKVILPNDEDRFVVNDGRLGQRCTFQLEVRVDGGKVMSSLPLVTRWPTVTKPKRRAFANGKDEVIFFWGDSKSINNGMIDSYAVGVLSHFTRHVGCSSSCRSISTIPTVTWFTAVNRSRISTGNYRLET